MLGSAYLALADGAGIERFVKHPEPQMAPTTN